MAKKRTKPNITTIQITEETRDKLKERGKKGDTYDDVIRDLLEQTSTRRKA
jgi:predicted CopG family antitoxin